LGDYYLTENMLGHAQQCFAAAEAMLKQVPPKTQNTRRDEEDEGAPSNEMNLHIAWGKYYLQHLKNSAHAAKLDPENYKIKVKTDERETEEVLFKELQEGSEVDHTLKYIINFEEVSHAREMFLKALEHFNSAKKYYVLDGFVTEHFNILQDISSLYGALIVFEKDSDRVCKMIKRRIDLFEPLVQLLNPQHFTFMLQQITFRLGELYSELAEEKFMMIEKEEEGIIKSTPAAARQVKKTNSLISSSAKYFQQFVGMFPINNTYNVEIEKENIEAYLMARLSIARLYSKLVTEQPVVQTKNLTSSLEQYKWISNYADRHKTETSAFQAEVFVCKQMVELLPLKISSIQQNK